MKVKIENIVSSITLGQDINLEEFANSVKEVDNPERFPGVIFRLDKPKLAMLIFRTGKVICSGARSKDEINIAVNTLLKKFREAGITISRIPDIEIQNIVASSNLDFRVNLDALAMDCINTEYEPEQFPGLIFRLDDPKTVMLVFRSGKIIVTGAKTPHDAERAAEITRNTIKNTSAIIK
ncbi:MAG TPA: TATA-box-binding protein [Candidatus Altiarchaeales archaeon]|nr:TATA-box-binding protein [Candidatus Altiarchaeales archaeon]